MTKNIWAGLIALIMVITCGVLEVVFISREYERLEDYCVEIIAKCENESLTLDEYNVFRERWVKLRETSEIFLQEVRRLPALCHSIQCHDTCD